MSSFDDLAKLVVTEAPISSYLKSIGRGVKNVARTAVSPAAYLKGAANVARGVGSTIGKYSQTSSNTLPGVLSTGANALNATASGLTKARKWLRDPGSADYGDTLSEKPPKKGDIFAIQTKAKTVNGKAVNSIKRNDQIIIQIKFSKEIPKNQKSNSNANGANIFISKNGSTTAVLTSNNKPVSPRLPVTISPTTKDRNWSLSI